MQGRGPLLDDWRKCLDLRRVAQEGAYQPLGACSQGTQAASEANSFSQLFPQYFWPEFFRIKLFLKLGEVLFVNKESMVTPEGLTPQ